MWETFSDWLITAGLIMAAFAIIAFVIDFVGGKQIHTLAWPYAVGYVLAVLLSLINAFVHSRDGYTAVVPTGLTLSGARRRHSAIHGLGGFGPGISPSRWSKHMMHALKIAHSVKRPRLVLVLVAIAGLGLAGCDYDGGDPKIQIGANPPLPALQQYLIPPIQIAKVVGWGKETPTRAAGIAGPCIGHRL